MSDSLFEAIEPDDFLPGMHNPSALVHNPFEWNDAEDVSGVEDDD